MSRKHVLIVDDEKPVRDSRTLLLRSAGYDVSTAVHGFDALLQLRTKDPPDLIISDLNMPHMSGFEFLSVLRRRFPKIPVIACSGAYHSGDLIPGGIIADGFVSKGFSGPEVMLSKVADLLAESSDRVLARHSDAAPVWIPRNGKDSNGIPFIVITCPECLRSFPLSVSGDVIPEVQETECLFCPTTVKYIIDFSRDVSSHRDKAAARGAASNGQSGPSMEPKP
jgi:CheY-like chemotaxis protein